MILMSDAVKESRLLVVSNHVVTERYLPVLSQESTVTKSKKELFNVISIADIYCLNQDTL